MIREQVEARIHELEQWVADLQSGMYVNCVYCGYRYGPNPETSTSLADVLKAHVQQCPKHPMAALSRRLARAKMVISTLVGATEVGELQAMLAVLRSARGPMSDRSAAIDAIEFLIDDTAKAAEADA